MKREHRCVVQAMLMAVICMSVAFSQPPTRVYGPTMENLYESVIKPSSGNPYWWAVGHKLGAVCQSTVYEARSVNTWLWNYEDFPAGATVTSVIMDFKARRSTPYEDFRFGLYNIPYSISGSHSTDVWNSFTPTNKMYEAALPHDGTGRVSFQHTFTPNDGSGVCAAISSAIQSANYFFTLGIRIEGSSSCQWWEIYPYEGTEEDEQPAIRLTVSFIPPEYNVQFKNDLDGGSYGTITATDRDGVPHELASGSSLPFYWGDQTTVTAFTGKYQYNGLNWKFHTWTQGNTGDNQNPKNFTIFEERPVMAYFTPVFDVTVRNDFEGYEAGQLIYEGNPVNSGYTDQDVFRLDMRSFSAATPQTDGGFTWNFLQWNDGATSVNRNVSVTSTLTYEARFKANRASSLSTTTAPTSQRKLQLPLMGGPVLLVYESQGDVWLTEGGEPWSPERLLSRGTGTARNPSVAAVGNALHDTTCFVWVDTTVHEGNTKYTVYFRKYAYSTRNLGPIERADFGATQYWARPDAKPVAARIGAMPDWPDVTIAFEAQDDGIIVTHRYYYGSHGIIWSAQQVPGTSPHCARPSLSVSYDQFPSRNFALTFDGATEDPEKYGYHVYLSLSGDVGPAPPSFEEPEQVSTSETEYNSHAALSVIDAIKYVTWIGYDWWSGMNMIMVRQWDREWSRVQAFVDDLGDPIDLTSTISAHEGLDGATLVWADKSVVVNMVAPNGLDWFTQDYATYGTDIYAANTAAIAPSFSVLFVLTKNNSAPFEVRYEWRDNSYWYDDVQELPKGTELTERDSTRTGARYFHRISMQEMNGKGRAVVQYGAIEFLTPQGTRLVKPRLLNSRSEQPRTSSFRLSSSSILTMDFGIKTKDIRVPLVVTVDLIDSTTGSTIGELFTRTYPAGRDEDVMLHVRRPLPAISNGNPLYASLRVENVHGYNQQYSSLLVVGNNGVAFKSNNTANSAGVPVEYALHQNYPNPFNPSTQIDYDLPEPGNVALVVYDILGREVSRLATGHHEAGYYSAVWNGTNSGGHSVASGVYFARFVVTNDVGSVKYNKLLKLMMIK
jgi:hypothetical protein